MHGELNPTPSIQRKDLFGGPPIQRLCWLSLSIAFRVQWVKEEAFHNGENNQLIRYSVKDKWAFKLPRIYDWVSNSINYSYSVKNSTPTYSAI